uniref:Uncharacterized protein n=1 Tax=Arundo donax TaxID=35708 RepID=A0A0A9C9L4_ARUDO
MFRNSLMVTIVSENCMRGSTKPSSLHICHRQLFSLLLMKIASLPTYSAPFFRGHERPLHCSRWVHLQSRCDQRLARQRVRGVSPDQPASCAL